MSTIEEIDDSEIGSDALAPGSKLLSGQYEIIRYLSSGGFGITYLAKDSLNRTVVIKECFPEAFCSRVKKTVRARTKNYVEDFRSIVKLFIREAHALSRLDHPSVVGVHQVFEDNETAYMALDLIDGKDLLEVIESGSPKMTPSEITKMTLRLLDAIAHVHGQDLLHRDISPDNILVDKTGHPVLIDFGAAREEASRKSRVLSSVLVVKDGYSPQEFYVAGSQQLPCSDLYALAATLAHLVSGEAPPNSQARLAALASNQPDLYEPLTGRFPQYDDAFLQAIDKAMAIVPSERLQSAEDWSLMIDHSKRVELARQRALKDKTIDQTVMNLVRTVNVEPEPLEQGISNPGQNLEPLEKKSDSPAETCVEDLRALDLVDVGAITLPAVENDDNKPTPYVRVKSKAVKAAQEALEVKKSPKPRRSPRQYIRMATIPFVFCAYFFYGYILLQYDAVQAATVQPILDWKEELSKPKRSSVTILRLSES